MAVVNTTEEVTIMVTGSRRSPESVQGRKKNGEQRWPGQQRYLKPKTWDCGPGHRRVVRSCHALRTEGL